MEEVSLEIDFDKLDNALTGKVKFDELSKIIYSTDASVYMERPMAIAYPETEQDLLSLVQFASENNVSLIPRAAGTSLAGQVVGNGIVIDFSKMNKILEFNQARAEVTVQPGVVRDELNQFLKPYGLFFSPITSTANRAMIGGMVGNNSCGTNSIKYGSTRDKIVSVKTVLYSGDVTTFGPENPLQLPEAVSDDASIHLRQKMHHLLFSEENRATIEKGYPGPNISRRNTGYALDYLAQCYPYKSHGPDFNLAKILTGSEGTLALFSEITIKLDPLPPSFGVVVAVHFDRLQNCFKATQIAMEYQPYACELMDKIILDCTKTNIQQKQNRFFIEGEPEGLLMIEFRDDTRNKCDEWAENLIAHLKRENLGYAYPKIYDADIARVWVLRSSGLGVLANIPGDDKAVACIEDTAVAIEDLPAYMEEFHMMMDSFQQKAVYYAHAGAGEIHLRPILNLKTRKGVNEFYEISKASAELVKKYGGSLSGEHGDGRVRAPFIPLVLGEEVYELLEKVKEIWDPKGIFNPGKIIKPVSMDEMLRTEPGQKTPEIKTMYDFSSQGGVVRFAEKCNGSGDCRKLPLSGGTMCPSYHATRDEKDTTRARANALRDLLNNHGTEGFYTDELSEVLELCLACKACTSECPSNINMTMLKSEALYQKGKKEGFSLRSKIFGQFGRLFRFASYSPFLANSVIKSGPMRRLLDIAPNRSLPGIAKTALRKWYAANYVPDKSCRKEVVLFVDEFTEYLEPEIGIKAIKLLDRLGFKVTIVDHPESGRAALSRGLLDYARKVAEKNVQVFSQMVSDDLPLVGIEPSAILSFKDEYPRLVSDPLKASADFLSGHVYLIEDFLYQEVIKGQLSAEYFTTDPKKIVYHGHCHQKSLSNQENALMLLSVPAHFSVKKLETGCCGMAGSFGYEKEHFEISKKIANISLVPGIESADAETIIVASGTSCRHQILDLTGRKALHPVEVLYDGLK